MTKPIHTMTPQELADAGIPVEVALRARIEEAEKMGPAVDEATDYVYFVGKQAGLRDALAIIEAKS